MSGTAFEIGQQAVKRALAAARGSSRAAKVAALVVPLAALAGMPDAHAGISCQVASSVSGNTPTSGSFSGCVGQDAYNGNWTVTSGSGNYHYNFTVSDNGGLTELDVALHNAGDVSGVTVTDGWSYSILATGSSDWASTPKFSPGAVIEATGSGSSLNIQFDSVFAPELDPYEVVFFGDQLIIDPPSPAGPSAVPEPATLSLFGVALVGFAAWRRKRTQV